MAALGAREGLPSGAAIARRYVIDCVMWLMWMALVMSSKRVSTAFAPRKLVICMSHETNVQPFACADQVAPRPHDVQQHARPRTARSAFAMVALPRSQFSKTARCRQARRRLT